MSILRQLGVLMLATCVACTDSAEPSTDESVGMRIDAGDRRAASDPSDASTPGAAGDAVFVACEPETLSPFGANVAFECEICGPNGSCSSPDPSVGTCNCHPRYMGDHCELCVEGFVDQDGECLDMCEAAGDPCSGTCTGTAAAPSCECRLGYEGTDCDSCAPGFGPDPHVFDALGCIPTCGGACVSGEVCTASSRDEQSCECTVGYERDDGGDCAWQGLIADPRFEQGCAHWRLYRQGGNAGDAIVVGLERGALTLSVDHKCSFAMASAEAYLPTDAMQGAAIELTASGSSGAKLHVSFEEPEGLPQSIGMALIGTGERKSYVVCLPLWEQGLRGAVTLTVGEGGVCAEALEARFVVHAVEVIVDPGCGGNGP